MTTASRPNLNMNIYKSTLTRGQHNDHSIEAKFKHEHLQFKAGKKLLQ